VDRSPETLLLSKALSSNANRDIRGSPIFLWIGITSRSPSAKTAGTAEWLGDMRRKFSMCQLQQSSESAGNEDHLDRAGCGEVLQVPETGCRKCNAESEAVI
jgi:hypothetical protein